MESHQLEAYNTATDSDNKIHDDEVAAKFGFTGGLVPGVDIWAYLTHPPVMAWGMDWLTRGTMSGRLAKPVYDGEMINVEPSAVSTSPTGLTAKVEIRNSHELVPADATVSLPNESVAPVDVGRYEHAPLPAPEDRPPAGFDTLVTGQVLGSIDARFHADKHVEYLRDVRETAPIYSTEKIAHPGHLLRSANAVISQNVLLGPWIHVSSDVQHHGVVHDGAMVSTRGIVAETFERKGHQFVRVDALVLADDVPVMAIDHVAIFRPRQLLG